MKTHSEEHRSADLSPAERGYLLASPINLLDVQSALNRYDIAEALFPLEPEESRQQRLNGLAGDLLTFQPQAQESMAGMLYRDTSVRSGRRGSLFGATQEHMDSRYDRRRIDHQVGMLSKKLTEVSLKLASQRVAEMQYSLAYEVVGPVWLGEKIDKAYAFLVNARRGILIQKKALQIPDALYPVRHPHTYMKLSSLEHQLDGLDEQLRLIATRRQ